MPTLTMEEARAKLTRLPEQLASSAGEAVMVTRRGKPVLAVMAWEAYEAMAETLEVLNDPEQSAALQRSVQEIAEGKTRAWEAIKAERGL